MEFRIAKENDGMTVLSFLKMKLKISRNALSALKRTDMGICANGQHVTVRYILKEGDLLTVCDTDSFDDTNESIIPKDIPINVIYEDESLFLIDKPADMPTHPSHNHAEDTLANALAHIYLERGEALVFRPIGRLDRNTSGISLIAKNSISASYLHYAKTKGLIQKKYIAILEGCVSDDDEWHRTVIHMKRMDDSIIVRCTADSSDENAFIAITRWRMLYSNGVISLVEAIPETGRTHQLRVNFAHLGHPIVGDDVYGHPSELIPRHALHAYYLSLPMPYEGEITEFVSSPPMDMQDAFKKLCQVDLDSLIDERKKEKQ